MSLKPSLCLLWLSVAHPALAGDFDAMSGETPVTVLPAAKPALREGLNHHLNQYRLAWRIHDTFRDDLDGIAKRGVLRVITRPDPDNYFLSKGERAGFEYDLIREFATRRGLRMEVIVADSDAQMLAWLKEGIGDIVTARVDADLTEGDPDVALTRRYHYAAPVLVGRSGLADPGRLAGRRVFVRDNSLYARAFRKEAPRLGFELIEAPEAFTEDDILEEVAAGGADYTVIEGGRLAEALKHRHGLRAVKTLDDRHPYRYSVRAANAKLYAALDGFLREEYGSWFYRVTFQRYFDERDYYAMDAVGAYAISPYDELVQGYSDRYRFDWRLILALMYQESQFNPHAVSSKGARGLMQLMPQTARGMGFRDIDRPEVSVHAGVQYLDSQRSQFEDTLPVDARTWFALAAYHCGFERVQSARRLAARTGLDADRWFGHVEKAMLALGQRPAVGRLDTSHWTGKTVAYVREIRSRYEAYLQLKATVRLAANEPHRPRRVADNG